MDDFQGYVTKYTDIIQKIIMAPAVFFREMPKSGGFVDPLIFMVVMGFLAGIVGAIVALLGIGLRVSFMMAIGSVIIVPVFTVIFGFIGAGVLFLIWKLMGSQETYEVAFRCLAYATAISPITGLFGAIPYIGGALGLVWMTYLLVNASTEVHNLQARTSWIVFGAICAVLALTSINSQITARKTARRLETLQNQMGQINQMKPEEAGKAVGEFLKGVQKGTQ